MSTKKTKKSGTPYAEQETVREPIEKAWKEKEKRVFFCLCSVQCSRSKQVAPNLGMHQHTKSGMVLCGMRMCDNTSEGEPLEFKRKSKDEMKEECARE